MVFKKIITEIAGVTDNFYKIKTDDPTKNQQIVKKFGLDFVKKWTVKLDAVTPNTNKNIFYSIFFYYLSISKIKPDFIESEAEDLLDDIDYISHLYSDNPNIFTKLNGNLFSFYNINQLTSQLKASSGSYSTAQYTNKKEVSKKNIDGEGYSDWEIKTFDLMKKYPNLFPKIYTISDEKVSVEKLDTERFEKTFEVVNEIIYKTSLHFSAKDLLSDIGNWYFSQNELNSRLRTINDNYDDKDKKYIVWFFNLVKYCIKVKNLIKSRKSEFDDDIRLDFNFWNFGYRRGTNEIINFDPIFVHRRDEID